MYRLTLLKDDSDEIKDLGLEVELDNDCLSVYNLFKAIESIMLASGYFDEHDIREYYSREQNQGILN